MSTTGEVRMGRRWLPMTMAIAAVGGAAVAVPTAAVAAPEKPPAVPPPGPSISYGAGGLQPVVPERLSPCDTSVDSDADGTGDCAEFSAGTDPLTPD